MTASPNHAAAHAYAERALFVLPIWWVGNFGACGCGSTHSDQPNNIGKHPIAPLVPRGHLDATIDLDTIDRWWTQYPNANIAVACDRSALVVIDIDPRNDGHITWANITSEIAVPETMRAATGGGGYHHFFTAELNDEYRGKLGPGVEVKHKGYVLVAPSNHKSGETYRWDTEGVRPSLLGPLRERVVVGGHHSTGSERVDVASILDGIADGERHIKLVSYVASLRARRTPYAEAKVLVHAAVERADGDFPMDEAMRILDEMWDRLPEGTTAENELKAYEAYINANRPQPQPQQSSGPTTDDSPPPDVPSQVDPRVEQLEQVNELIRPMVLEEMKRIEVTRKAREILESVYDDDENDGRPSRLINAVEFCQFEDPPWLVEWLLPPLGLCMAYGPKGQAKSYVKLDLALSIANDSVTSWFGHQINLHGEVVFVLMEGRYRFKNRIRAWLRAHPGTTAERLWILPEKSLDLASEASVKRLARDIAALGVKPVMIVIDTQGQALANADENGASDINAAYRNVRQHLGNAFDCLVSLVHHTGHDETRERGSSAQGGAVDAKFIVNRGKIHFDKIKAGPDQKPMFFELAEVPEVADVFVRQIDGMAPAVREAQRNVGIEQRIIEYVSAHPGCSGKMIKDSLGGNSVDVGGCITALLMSGRLVNDGTEARRKIRLAGTVAERDEDV